MESISQMSFLVKADKEKLIERELKRGSCFEGGKDRIKEMYEKLNKEERIKAIKEEYGVGGWAGKNIDEVNSNAKGIMIGKEEIKINLTWEQVEERIQKMIVEGTY